MSWRCSPLPPCCSRPPRSPPAAGARSEASAKANCTRPFGIAVDQTSGDVYVADTEKERVLVYEAGGASLLATIEGPETPAKGLTPTALAIDDSTNALDANLGDLYVADNAANVIDKFSPAHTYLAQITGTPAGPFESIAGVAVDAHGNVWVSQASGEVAEFASNEANSLVTSWNTNQGARSEGQLALNPSGSEVLPVLGANNVARFTTGGSEIAGTRPRAGDGCRGRPRLGQRVRR